MYGVPISIVVCIALYVYLTILFKKTFSKDLFYQSTKKMFNIFHGEMMIQDGFLNIKLKIIFRLLILSALMLLSYFIRPTIATFLFAIFIPLDIFKLQDQKRGLKKEVPEPLKANGKAIIKAYSMIIVSSILYYSAFMLDLLLRK